MNSDAPPQSSQKPRASLIPIEQNGDPMDTDPGPEPLSRPGSKHWLRFQSALRLAIQRVCYKWTYEEFAQCFPLMCEEEAQQAMEVFDDVRKFMSVTMEQKCEELFNQYTPAVNEGIDELSQMSREAKQRLAAGGYEGKDVWRDNIAPRDAVRARTIPLLEAERERLQNELAELEQECALFQAEMKANVKAKEETDAETTRVLDALEEVLAKWESLPEDDVGVA